MDLQATSFKAETESGILGDVLPLCELARSFEEAGEFELAEETLRPFWQGVPHRPITSGLSETARAELLLRTGTITGWIGSAKQIPAAQEAAKDLLSESASIFVELGIREKEAE